jgi:hypothetical protein
MRKREKVMAAVFIFLFSVILMAGTESKASEAVVTPTEVVTGAENVTANNYTYSVPSKISYSDTEDVTIVPISMNKAGELYIRINSSALADDVKLSLWKDEAGTLPAAGTYDYITANPNEVKEDAINISAAGMYYLRIAYNYTGITSGSINLSFYNVSAEDRTLKSGELSAVASSYNTRVTYAKINVEKSGYIGVYQNNAKGSSMSVAVCDSSKNQLAAKYITPGKYFYYPVQKGTYYLKTSGTTVISYLKYAFQNNFELTKQGTLLTVPLMGSSTFDVKIKADKTGLLTVKQELQNSWYCTFLDAKKKALSDRLWNYGGANAIAVKKGQTYYLRIEATIGSEDRALSYTISKASTKKNTSAKKAVTLKKGKKQVTLILPGDSKYHYYKLKLSKKKILNMYFDASGNGTYKYQLTKGSRSFLIKADTTKKKIYSYSKLDKGTYYLKIKADSKSSGKFTLKLK